MQALTGSRWRQAVSEGSLPPTGRAPPAPSGTGGAAREGDIKSARDQVGGGRGVSAGGNSVEENGDVSRVDSLLIVFFKN